jgi:hypothetical protein
LRSRAKRRVALIAVALLGLLVSSKISAPAAVDMSVGIRHVSPDGTLADCSAKAKDALNAYLQNAAESSAGSGEWLAFSSNGIAGTPTAAATVRCYGLTTGYVVTFTCVVQLPDNPYSADALCLDVAHKFYGGTQTALAPIPTPTPVPTGCTTANLLGTWVSNDKSGPSFTMDPNGGLLDNEGVSGNWILKGMTAVLTYYGEHTLTLSSDGKHLNGGGYALTRKC